MRSVKFEIDHKYSRLPRSQGEEDAQARAAARGHPGDQGGHGAGHRFSENQGDINQFPQARNFNNSAYRTMENEVAAWADNGYRVEGTVHVDQTGGSRPDTVEVSYVVADPVTGDVVHYRSVVFQNQDGVTFDRVPASQMANPDVLFEGRPAGDVPAASGAATVAAPPASTEPDADGSTAAAPPASTEDRPED